MLWMMHISNDLNTISSISFGDTRAVRLEDVATIIRAPLFKTETTRTTDPFQVVSIKGFPRAGFLPNPDREIFLDTNAERAAQYTLRPYDLLVVTVGTIGELTIVGPDCGENWVPATNMYVVRFLEEQEERSRTVYGLFKSREGQALLSSMAHGRGIQIVPKKKFARIAIPEFTRDLHDAMAMLWNREHELVAQADRLISQAAAVFQDVDLESRLTGENALLTTQRAG
jgi:hypothetical protein